MNRRTFLKSVPVLTILAAARPNLTEAVKEKAESEKKDEAVTETASLMITNLTNKLAKAETKIADLEKMVKSDNPITTPE